MKPLCRRDFLKSATAAVPLLSRWNLPAATTPAPGQLRIGLCADVHQDVIHDGEERLRAFTERATRDRLDFIVQLGDFCRPELKNRRFLEQWETFAGPRYHTLGNHDNDGGYRWEQVLEFWKMPQRYYAFDRAGWHFVVLDGNEIKPDRRVPGYPRYVGEVQLAWLREDLRQTKAPTIVFSHQSLQDPDGVENAAEIRAVLEQANVDAGWRKVGACLSGHHHIDFAIAIAGIHYVQINSMSYSWLGEPYSHVRYGTAVDQSHPYLKYTAPYRDPLFATLSLAAEEGLKIVGQRSEFVGPSPWELGMADSPGTARARDRLVPWISDRQLAWSIRG